MKKTMKPTDIPEEGLLCDLLWNAPDINCDRRGTNDRGVSVIFSEIVLKTFLEKNDLDLICRAHQVV